MSEDQDARQTLADAAKAPADTRALDSDELQYHGRYIPYSGGSAGWYENEGVPESERQNDYGFRNAVNRERVLQKRFGRLGSEVGRRQSERRGVNPPTPVSLTWGKRAVEGTLRDFSERGLRVRVTEDPRLSEGDTVSVRIHPSDFFKTELALLDAEIRWVKQVDQDETAWHLGISFTPV